jgi:ribonuclease Z
MGWVGGREQPLPVYGPAGTARMVAGYQQALEEDTKFRFAHHGDKLPAIGPAADVKEISATEDPVVVATIGDITVKAFHVDHRPVMPAYGFRFERDGKSIVISGDTNACQGLINGAQDADLLVVDSMNKAMMAQLEERLRGIGNKNQAALLEDAHSYHAGLEDSAKIAQDTGVKHLVFSHVLPPITDDQAPQFIEGLDKIYTGKMTVTHDLEKFAVG